MRHWTECLPEGKRIYRDEVDKLLSKQTAIHKLRINLNDLSAEVGELQDSIYAKTTSQFSKEEIASAMNEYDSHFEQ